MTRSRIPRSSIDLRDELVHDPVPAPRAVMRHNGEQALGPHDNPFRAVVGHASLHVEAHSSIEGQAPMDLWKFSLKSDPGFILLHRDSSLARPWASCRMSLSPLEDLPHVGTPPPARPKKSTGARPSTARRTSSTICPALISTTRNPFDRSAACGMIRWGTARA